MLCEAPPSFNTCRFYTQQLASRRVNPGPNKLDTWVASGSSYVLTYTASDAMGNLKNATRTVQIRDTIPPVITLKGGEGVVFLQFARNTPKFIPPVDRFGPSCPGVAADSVIYGTSISNLACLSVFDSLDGNVSCGVRPIEIQPALNNHNWSTTYPSGTTFTPYQRDAAGCFSRTRFEPNTDDYDLPRIPFLERECPTAPVSNSWATINASTPLSSSTLGPAWWVLYSAVDAAGNVGYAIRKVVLSKSAAPESVVELAIPTVPYGQLLTDQTRLESLAVFDEADGNVTDLVEAGKDQVNPEVPGLQVVTVMVSDRRGNSGLRNRTVRVLPEVYTVSREFTEIVVSGVTLRGVRASDFNIPAQFLNFKLAVLVALNNVRTLSVGSLGPSNFHKMLAVDVVGNKTVAGAIRQNRRADPAATPAPAIPVSTLNFTLAVNCSDVARISAELGRAIRDGLVSLELFRVDPTTYMNLFSPMPNGTNPPPLVLGGNWSSCPVVATTAPSKSGGSSGSLAIVYIVVPLVIVLLLVIVAVIWSRKQFSKRREKAQIMLNNMIVMQQQQMLDGGHIHGDFNIPMDDRPIYGATFMGNESSSDDEEAQENLRLGKAPTLVFMPTGLQSKSDPRGRLGTSSADDDDVFDNSRLLAARSGPRAALPVPVDEDDEDEGPPPERPAPPRPIKFLESSDDVYEGVATGGASKAGFSSHDKAGRSDELEDLYLASTGKERQPLARKPVLDLRPVPAPPPVDDDDAFAPAPVPKPKPKPAVVEETAFDFTEDNVYDGVATGLVKAGFKTHDKSARSEALDEIYSAALDQGAGPEVGKPWFKPDVPRGQVELFLSKQSAGAFVVYGTHKQQMIGVRTSGEGVQHVPVRRHFATNKVSLDTGDSDEPEFASLPELVSHYQQASAFMETRLLVTNNPTYVYVAPPPPPSPPGGFSPPPSPPPPARPPPAVSQFIESGEDVYEGVASGIVKAGFTTHDKSARSEELEDIYLAANEKPIPAGPGPGPGPGPGVCRVGRGDVRRRGGDGQERLHGPRQGRPLRGARGPVPCVGL
jgi:hypothetical protein